MKRELLNWLSDQQRPMNKSLKKKILIGLGIIGVFVFVSIGLLTYLGIKTANFLISKAPSQEQVLSVTQEISKQGTALIQGATTLDCWSTAQSYLNLTVWLTKPLSENVNHLMKACISVPPLEKKENNEEV